MNRRSWGERAFDSLNVVFMLCLAVLFIFPFLYIINYSLSDPTQISGRLLVVPLGLNFDSYRIAFHNSSIYNGILISVARTVSGSAIMLFFTSMAAYVLSRDDLMGVKNWRKFFIFTLYFNSGIIPMYILMYELHLAGTFLVYILPTAVSAFNLILVKTYIESMPQELEESAVVDGANDIYLFFRIIFPLSQPVLAVVTLFTCLVQWNAFVDTQFYNAMNPQLWPIQYVLYNALQSISSIEQLTRGDETAVQLVTPGSLKMAITVITIIPIMAVYPLLQKYFVKGLLIGSIKG